jgi:hypothetical protein
MTAIIYISFVNISFSMYRKKMDGALAANQTVNQPVSTSLQIAWK